MNCSFCGRPLPPDGVCRFCIPVSPARGPVSPLMPRKKLTSAAWFAPVTVFLLYLGSLGENMLNTVIYSKVVEVDFTGETFTHTNYLQYSWLSGLLLIAGGLLILPLSFLFYSLATLSWEKTLRQAMRPLLFVPIFFWALAGSVNSMFSSVFQSMINSNRMSITLYSILNLAAGVVTTILFAILSLPATVALLKRAEKHELAPERVSPARCSSAAWFLPVAVLLTAIVELGVSLFDSLLSFLPSLVSGNSYGTNGNSAQMTVMTGLNIMGLATTLLCVGMSLALWAIAAEDWGKQHRSAYVSLAFVPYGLYSVMVRFSGFINGIVYGYYYEGILDSRVYSAFSAVSSLTVPIVLGLIAAGIAIPIAKGMMRKIRAHEDALSERETPSAPAYGPAPVNAPVNAPAYTPAQPYPAQATAYDPAPSYGNAPDDGAAAQTPDPQGT
ncbi:MAG: hypothetical protein IK104_03915 [Clostridia bacterium]|nr:hypothetical protein [Clostridia bacterium]